MVQYYFKKLNVFKSAVPNDMHQRAPKDLADIIAEALAIYHTEDVKRQSNGSASEHHFCQCSALHHFSSKPKKQRSYTKCTLFALHWPLKTPFTQPYPIFLWHFHNLRIPNINSVWVLRACIMLVILIIKE